MLGLIVGFLSLTITSPIVPIADASEYNQTDDKQSSDQEITSITSFDAITSSLHLDLSKEIFFIETLPTFEPQKEEEIRTDQLVFSGDKVLKILFRRIISPNAP